MILIHIGISIYPIKDAAESDPVFSKYKVFEYFWDPK